LRVIVRIKTAVSDSGDENLTYVFAMNVKLLVFAGVLVLLGLWGVSVNNGLVDKEETVKSRWAQVENQYQRRSDLIPNLVETVKAAANFEQETLTQVADARSKATSIQLSADALKDPVAFAKFQEAQSELTGALSRLMMTAEKYPDLKANQNFADLSVQLEGTENRIATERGRYNEAAQTFNSSVRKFPASLFAGILGFEKVAYFEAEKGAAAAPKVSFN
jgi:LemA protein